MTDEEVEMSREAAWRQGYYFGLKHAYYMATAGLAIEESLPEQLEYLTEAYDALDAYRAARAKK